ncbi:MAG: hypothetical protein CMK59_08745 [Proteobacteria bacterium]|nr:hypothetical protein [Pseudomonadota bacterium]
MILPEWFKNNDNVLLLVVLLLLMWLLTRIEQRKIQPILKRPAPMNPDELAREIYRSLLLCDLNLFRSLFINALEAKSLLGQHANAYLELRTTLVIKDLFEDLRNSVSNQTEFCGIDNRGKILSLLVQRDLETEAVQIGSICRVGYTCRILVPFNLKQQMQEI